MMETGRADVETLHELPEFEHEVDRVVRLLLDRPHGSHFSHSIHFRPGRVQPLMSTIVCRVYTLRKMTFCRLSSKETTNL